MPNKAYKNNDGAFARFLWVLIIFFILSFGYIIGWSISNTFFIKRFGVEFYPMIFIINGFSVLIASYIYLKLVHKVRATTLFRWICIIFTLFISISILLIKFNLPIAYPIFIVLVEIAKVVFLMQMFNLFNMFFSPFEGKKYFPYIMIGALGGYVIGGVLVNVFSDMMDLTNFLWIWILSLLFAIFLFSVISRKYKNRFLLIEEYKNEKHNKDGPSLRKVLSIPLARMLGLSRLFIYFTIFTIFFIFIRFINEKFSVETDLASFLSFYASASAFVILFLHLFVNKFLLKLFGVRKSLYIWPAFLLAGSASNTIAPVFWNVVGLHFGRDIIQNSINYYSLNLVFPTFPRKLRSEARSFIDGIMAQIGIVLAGLFLSLQLITDYHYLFLLLSITSLLAVFCIKIANKKFLLQMLKNLSSTDRELVANTIQLFGEKQNKKMIPWFLVLLKRSPDIEYKINLIKSLGLIGDKSVIKSLIPYVIHENKSIRIAALESISNFTKANLLYVLLMVIAKERDPEVIEFAIESIGKYNENTIRHLTNFLKDENPRIRASAIDAIGSFGKPDNAHLLVSHLDDHDPIVRASVIGALYRFKKDRELCEKSLKDLMSGATIKEKKAACFAIGTAGIVEKFSFLESMFYEEKDLELKLEAIDSMIKIGELQSEYMIVSLITSEDERIAKKTARLLQHLPVNTREKIIEAIIVKDEKTVEYVKKILLDCGVFYKEETEMLERFR